MRGSYERAADAIRDFNRDEERTKVPSDVFFALAHDLICRRDGMRVSPVLVDGDACVMVLELTDWAGKKRRLLALWREGEGRILKDRSVHGNFRHHLKYEPTGSSMMPEGVARLCMNGLAYLAGIPAREMAMA